MDAVANYPSPLIDPRDKGYDYILAYVQAAYREGCGYMPIQVGNLGRSKFTEIKQYSMGKQSISKYKKLQPGTEIEDNTEIALDASPLAILPKFREIAISKLMQREYNIQATAVDPLSRSEEDIFFNQMKLKIMMREIAQKAGSTLANSPVLKASPDEPKDMDELKMQVDYTYKHVLCMEAEEAIQLVMQQNNIEEERKRVCESMFDYGIGFYKDWIDENGKENFRAVDMVNFMCSFCQKPDFSDMVHAGEFLEIMVADLAPYFDEKQMRYICECVAGKYGNPSTFTPTGSGYWNRWKVLVWDFQFITFNTYAYATEVDSRGNERFGKVDFSYLNKSADYLENPKGEPYPKYASSRVKTKMKCKWIVDTDMMYDYGIAENQGRKKSNWWDTRLDFVGYSWNFHRMVYSGITERLMPVADAIQLTWMKLQNLKNKLIPYLIDIDLTALENVAIGQGGIGMKPMELIDFAFDNFILLHRTDPLISEKNPNYKAMTITPSGQLQAFAQLYSDLEMQINMMRQISGLNELTDGSTPNAKTLVPVAEAAVQSTNNALYLISNGERQLMQRLADQIMLKVQIAVKLGKVEGYLKPLGEQSVKFLSINPDISLREFGIFLEDMPTETQREALWAQVNAKDSNGLLTIADKAMVWSIKSLKLATQILDYKLKKAQDEARQFELQKIQQATQGNAQIAQMTAQLTQQTMQMQGQIDLQKIAAETQGQYVIEAMKKSSDLDEAHVQAQAKIIANQILANAKIATSNKLTA